MSQISCFSYIRSRNLLAKSRSERWRTVHCEKFMHVFVGHMQCIGVVCLSYCKKFISWLNFENILISLHFLKNMHAFWCTDDITTVAATSTRLLLMFQSQKSPVFVWGSQPELLKTEHWLLGMRRAAQKVSWHHIVLPHKNVILLFVLNKLYEDWFLVSSLKSSREN